MIVGPGSQQHVDNLFAKNIKYCTGIQDRQSKADLGLTQVKYSMLNLNKGLLS